MFEKIGQLWVRLGFVTYILVKRLLYQQGYIVVNGEYWFNMLKWPRDPKYYSIDRKNNIVFFIRISEYKAYESKSSGLLKPICDSPLKYIYHYNGEYITVNFSDLDDNLAKVEALLLQESFDTLCGASVIYLTIEDNILPSYDKVQKIVDRAVNSSLVKLTDLGRRTKVLEILPQVWHK
ncbi:hypothetical protein RclHR1_40030001 [Rhizophagus clarus]|uniref:Uncharacterized protein n=1 Tax=Rhizophagus clarus TaxID=94130 RepID=A0A2Z6S8V7_9GLOM|nr:hypothetical protein RclHR1_40030001 [Rhizophagus clarus]